MARGGLSRHRRNSGGGSEKNRSVIIASLLRNRFILHFCIGVRRLKAAAICIFLLVLFSSMIACGGYKSSSSSNSTPTSGIKTRALVSNFFSGNLQIVNYSNDTLATQTIFATIEPETMVVSPDKKLTLVFGAGANNMVLVNNATESAVATLTLPNPAASFVINPGATTAYVAVRNSNQINLIDLVNNAFSATTIPVTLPRQLVLNNAGSTLLAFSDNSDFFTVVKTADNTTQTVGPAGFSRPVYASFSGDDKTAYVINCGPECGGGGSASVVPVDMTQTPPLPGAPIPIRAGTISMLNGGTLLVAGTDVTISPAQGVLTAINIATPPLTAPAGVTISDGTHYLFSLASNNKLFIGAKACSNLSCLSIYDTSAGTAMIVTSGGDVTGMTPIPNRNVEYVIQGGKLAIYDTTSDTPTFPLDFGGQVWDVKAID